MLYEVITAVGVDRGDEREVRQVAEPAHARRRKAETEKRAEARLVARIAPQRERMAPEIVPQLVADDRGELRLVV